MSIRAMVTASMHPIRFAQRQVDQMVDALMQCAERLEARAGQIATNGPDSVTLSSKAITK